jgi:hypothetical protein
MVAVVGLWLVAAKSVWAGGVCTCEDIHNNNRPCTCSAAGVAVCNSAGDSVTGDWCCRDNNQACSNGGQCCAGYCISNRCSACAPADVCVAGTLRCGPSENVEQCNATNCGWTQVQNCLGRGCAPNNQCNECPDSDRGKVFCRGNKLDKCQDGFGGPNFWQLYQNCPLGCNSSTDPDRCVENGYCENIMCCTTYVAERLTPPPVPYPTAGGGNMANCAASYEDFRKGNYLSGYPRCISNTSCGGGCHPTLVTCSGAENVSPCPPSWDPSLTVKWTDNCGGIDCRRPVAAWDLCGTGITPPRSS